MRLPMFALVAALAVAIASGEASAAVIQSTVAGTGLVGGLTDSVPGVPVALDYTPMGVAPAELVGFSLAFQTSGVMFGQLKVKLDAGPDVYSFDSLNGQQVAHTLYDPAWMTGSGSIPSSVLPQLWKDELTDGMLDCRVWVEGVTYGIPDGFSLAAQGWFLVPEPASLAMLALGFLGLGRRRRR